uniref:Uncharacterized protein n=1 Tax=Rhizophora mucronata TaxID=61149 RepID=A0A2P2JRG8_RHIMU
MAEIESIFCEFYTYFLGNVILYDLRTVGSRTYQLHNSTSLSLIP